MPTTAKNRATINPMALVRIEKNLAYHTRQLERREDEDPVMGERWKVSMCEYHKREIAKLEGQLQDQQQ